MNKTAILAAALLALAPAAVRAQNAVITGYDDLKWGTSRVGVTSYWRETPLAERREGGISLLTFKPFEGMTWVAGVDDRDGFVYLQGKSLPVASPAACEALFDRWVGRLTRRYTGIPQVGGKSNPAGGGLCDNVRAGTAQASVTWTDPVNGGVARLSVDPADGLVTWTTALSIHRLRAAEGGDAASAAPAASTITAATREIAFVAPSGIAGYDNGLWDPAAPAHRFRWGTPRAEIEQAYGQPMMTDTRDVPAGTGDLLFMGDDGHGMSFTIDPAGGLVRATSSTGLAGPGAPCAQVWERLRDRIAALMPGVTARGGMVNPGGGDLCEAVKAGTAFAEMVWPAADGSTLTLRIGERTGGISVIAASAGFQRWFDSSPLGQARAERIRRATGGAR